jgi:hypothetical protein
MNMHPLSAKYARRATVAGLLLVGTFVLCLWLGNYKDKGWSYPASERVGLSIPAGVHAPAPWAVPVAIAVGVVGATLAFLIFRQSRIRR